jgi:hypothetical protein
MPGACIMSLNNLPKAGPLSGIHSCDQNKVMVAAVTGPQFHKIKYIQLSIITRHLTKY